MADGRTFRVFDDRGYVGELSAPLKPMDPGGRKKIRLEDGREIEVGAEDLKVRPDGSFQLRAGRITPPSATPAPSPAMSQPSAMSQPQAADTIQASSPVKLGDDFYEHDYQIERVAIGRVLDGPVTQRQEGDTLILPVVEEVLVWEKKMILKEEIRVTTRKRPIQDVRRISADDPTLQRNGAARR